jgi:DNA ligase (NAD+)
MGNNDIQTLVDELTRHNDAYRRGQPLIKDQVYDEMVERLRTLAPEHPFLSEVEPEEFSGKQKIKHPEPMLSIQKAYTRRHLELYVIRVEKAASEIGLKDLTFQATAKLDGVAGRDDGNRLVTRGDGIFGFDVTDAFERGVVAMGGRGGGLGEIVMVNAYFELHLSDQFKHPRNLVVGIIKADKVSEAAQQPLKDKVVRFVVYARLDKWRGSGEALVDNIESIYRELTDEAEYPVDGIVAQVENEELKAYMGATEHHYKWQIAYKKKGESSNSIVRKVVWQVGRTGNITPVMEIDPVVLSGATIRRVTGHHAGMIRDLRVGPGAEIELIRSGEVIPKLEKVLKPADTIELVERCPACRTHLSWQGDFLRCTNHDECHCQVVQRIHHWFHILGNADWFGLKTVEKLVSGGLDCLEALYTETLAHTSFYYEAMGFGEVQSKNLVEAVQQSLSAPVEDWRFLAALGIPGLGVGDSRKLLAQFPLEQLWRLTREEIEAIKGFGEIKGRTITVGLAALRTTCNYLASLNFNIVPTPLLEVDGKSAANPIFGHGIVFTGKMVKGTRGDMQTLARGLGANVQTSVSGATKILVCGANVGTKKTEKARALGVRIISEQEFLSLVDHA